MLTCFLSDALTEDGKQPSQMASGTVPHSYQLLRVEGGHPISISRARGHSPGSTRASPQYDSVKTSMEKERQSEPLMTVNLVLLWAS